MHILSYCAFPLETHMNMIRDYDGILSVQGLSLSLHLEKEGMFWVQHKPIDNICDMLSTTGDHFKSTPHKSLVKL